MLEAKYLFNFLGFIFFLSQIQSWILMFMTSLRRHNTYVSIFLGYPMPRVSIDLKVKEPSEARFHTVEVHLMMLIEGPINIYLQHVLQTIIYLNIYFINTPLPPSN